MSGPPSGDRFPSDCFPSGLRDAVLSDIAAFHTVSPLLLPVFLARSLAPAGTFEPFSMPHSWLTIFSIGPSLPSAAGSPFVVFLSLATFGGLSRSKYVGSDWSLLPKSLGGV